MEQPENTILPVYEGQGRDTDYGDQGAADYSYNDNYDDTYDDTGYEEKEEYNPPEPEYNPPAPPRYDNPPIYNR